MISFVKREAVLCIAGVFALVSMVLAPPSAAYLDYIDFRVLALLFCLMAVVAGLQSIGLFQRLAGRLLRMASNTRQLAALLIFLCFFASMLVTNDVALITFVPFAAMVLSLAGQQRLLILLIVLQTIAANLGSMLTPIGNPQNLYLYALSGMSPGAFFAVTGPVTLLAGVLLAASLLLIPRQPVAISAPTTAPAQGTGKKLATYLLLFLLSLGAVARLLHPAVPLLLVIGTLLLIDRSIFRKVDYCLLLTFLFFFICIGNLGSLPAVRTFLEQSIRGQEFAAGVLLSQVISNVPAAILLSGFTDIYRELLLGVDVGGLGTLVASLASLISYKHYAKEESAATGRYLAVFTVLNAAFLAALCIGVWLLYLR